MLTFTYENTGGTVTFYGGGSHTFLIKDYTGLSLVERDYKATTYAETDGQETLFSRAMPRAITISVDIIDKVASGILRNAIKILFKPGYLYVSDEGFKRRIYCNQITVSDPERILRGQISSFVVQFVCDNPYFEDVEETTCVIYGRDKNITTPFTLPRAFALKRSGADIYIDGDKEVEPKIIIKCNETIEKSSYIQAVLNSPMGGAVLSITGYTPYEGDIITIDIKERTVTSEKYGDLINNLSNASYLSKFILHPSLVQNKITVTISNVTSDIEVECKYRNLYNEAMVI